MTDRQDRGGDRLIVPHPLETDSVLLSGFKALATKYPGQAFVTIGWHPFLEIWPRTTAFLRGFQVKVAIPPELEPWWDARCHGNR